MKGRNLVLIGFMGTGKTTVGRHCAERLGLVFRDSDREIERRAGAGIADLFASSGEAEFRRIEREVIAELTEASGLVIATGGGAALDPENAVRLRASGLVVLLKATPETLLRRVGRSRNRPLLAHGDPQVRIASLLTERSARYRDAAHCHVDTTGLSIARVTDAVVSLYESMPECGSAAKNRVVGPEVER